MLADPLLVYTSAPTGATAAVAVTGTGAGVATCVRTGSGPTSATYRYVFGANHFLDVFVGRQVGKRNRYTVRFTESELVADVINSELNAVKTNSVYVVADLPPTGRTTNFAALCHGLAAFLYDATDAAILFNRVVDGEL